jgi:DNA-binding protein Fis
MPNGQNILIVADESETRSPPSRAVEGLTPEREPSAAAAADTGQGLEALIASLQREGETDLYARVIRAVERVLLAEVLLQTHGNQLRASAILGIDRKTLRQKLRNVGLTPRVASKT